MLNKTITFEKLQKQYDNMAPKETHYLISNCCGAYNKYYMNGENYSDINLCPECERHCEWEEE